MGFSMGFESIVFCVKSRPWRSWVCGVRAMRLTDLAIPPHGGAWVTNCKVEVVSFTDLMTLVVSRQGMDGSVFGCDS